MRVYNEKESKVCTISSGALALFAMLLRKFNKPSTTRLPERTRCAGPHSGSFRFRFVEHPRNHT